MRTKVTRVKCGVSLRDFRKQMLLSFRSNIFRPIPFAEIAAEPFKLLWSSVIMFASGSVLVLFAASSILTIPIWIPIRYAKTVLWRSYCKFRNARFVRRSGGVFKSYTNVGK